jgi:hypothetical protein
VAQSHHCSVSADSCRTGLVHQTDLPKKKKKETEDPQTLSKPQRRRRAKALRKKLQAEASARAQAKQKSQPTTPPSLSSEEDEEEGAEGGGEQVFSPFVVFCKFFSCSWSWTFFLYLSTRFLDAEHTIQRFLSDIRRASSGPKNAKAMLEENAHYQRLKAELARRELQATSSMAPETTATAIKTAFPLDPLAELTA